MSEIDYWKGFRDALEIAILEVNDPDKIRDLKERSILKVQTLEEEDLKYGNEKRCVAQKI